MESRHHRYLLRTVLILGTFSLGYLVGRFTDDLGNSESRTASGHRASFFSPNGTTLSAGDPAASTNARSDDLSSRTGLTAATADPKGTVIGRAAEALLLGSDLRRQRAFLTVLDEMQPGDAIGVRDLLEKTTVEGVFYENLWIQFWTRWGEIDGANAMEFILKSDRADGAVPLDLARVMRGWGATNPEEAARWLEKHQGQKHLGDALVGLAEGYASVNLAGATSLALQAAPSGDPLLGKLMESLSEQAVRQGRIHGLTAWFDQLPTSAEPGSPRAAAVGHVFWRLWNGDQERAADWVLQQSFTPWRNDQVIEDVARRLSQKDPAKAFEWLQGVPPSQGSRVYPGIRNVIEAWFKADPQAAAAQVESLAPGGFKSQAVAVQQTLPGVVGVVKTQLEP